VAGLLPSKYAQLKAVPALGARKRRKEKNVNRPAGAQLGGKKGGLSARPPVWRELGSRRGLTAFEKGEKEEICDEEKKKKEEEGGATFLPFFIGAVARRILAFRFCAGKGKGKKKGRKKTVPTFTIEYPKKKGRNGGACHFGSLVPLSAGERKEALYLLVTRKKGRAQTFPV